MPFREKGGWRLMPRPSRPWLRLYVEVVRGRKLRRRPVADRWLWVVVLAVARQSPRPGWLLVDEGTPMDERDLADEAALPLRDVRAGIKWMVESSMLTEHDGVWLVTNWCEYQFESDDVTERTAKHRSKEQRWDVPTNVPIPALGTPPENRDTDTETTTPPTPPNGNGSRSPAVSATPTCDGSSFEAFWFAYPKHKGKDAAKKAWDRVVKRADPSVVVAAAERYATDRSGQDPQFTPYPATWLNAGRWLDEPDPSPDDGLIGSGPVTARLMSDEELAAGL